MADCISFSMRHGDTRSFLSLLLSLSLSLSNYCEHEDFLAGLLASGLEGSPIAVSISRGTIRMPLNGDPRKNSRRSVLPVSGTDYERNARRTRSRRSNDRSLSLSLSDYSDIDLPRIIGRTNF